jgi:hypothetical protein
MPKTRKKPESIKKVVPVAPKIEEGLEEYRKGLCQRLEAYWVEEAEYYGWDMERPEVVTQKFQAVLRAVDRPTAEDLSRRARDTAQVMILGAWARKRIPGPLSVHSLERSIKKAESLAKMLENKGDSDGAESQLRRAADLRGQLELVQTTP